MSGVETSVVPTRRGGCYSVVRKFCARQCEKRGCSKQAKCACVAPVARRGSRSFLPVIYLSIGKHPGYPRIERLSCRRVSEVDLALPRAIAIQQGNLCRELSNRDRRDVQAISLTDPTTHASSVQGVGATMGPADTNFADQGFEMGQGCQS